MKPLRVSLLYFSPTGSTRRLVKAVAEGVGAEVADYDLTGFDARWKKYAFGPQDLVVVGMPVYGGRIPDLAVEFFRGVSADRTPAVAVVTYGNRDYEDALLELTERCGTAGFAVMAAGAFIGEHSLTADVARGRPDAQDRKAAFDFGTLIKARFEAGGTGANHLAIKGRKPYKARSTTPMAPTTDSRCDDCGLCARSCPTAAINPDDPREADRLRCIMCFKCVRECPKGAKSFDGPRIAETVAILKATCMARKEPELFI